MHSKSVVGEVFGKNFIYKKPKEGENPHENIEAEGQPIWYTIDALLMSYADREEVSKRFIEALSETSNMSVFQAEFIQRFICQ